MRTMSLIALSALIFLGCASEPEKPVSKANRATVVNDLFPVYSNMPVREVKKKDFFFKCNQETSWRPFSTATQQGSGAYACDNSF